MWCGSPANLCRSGSPTSACISTRSIWGTLRDRLVVLGDSISHGFKSFAIADTHLAWPKLVADAAGFEFRVSNYPGPKKCQGMPLNLEAVVRELEPHMPGSLIDVFEDVGVLTGFAG